MINNFFNPIATFASLKFQVRWLIYGNKENYLTLAEFVNNQFIENTEIWLSSYEQIPVKIVNDIKEFSAFVNTHVPLIKEFSSYKGHKEMVLHDSAWICIRKTAKNLLKKYNFDLKIWEEENLKNWSIPSDSPYIKEIEEVEQKESEEKEGVSP